MTLSFSTKWPKQMGELAGQPNYFIEKIWESVLHKTHDYLKYQQQHLTQFGDYWDGTGDMYHEPVNPKYHTIRAGSRWKKKLAIHPVINNRTQNRFQFAPIMACESVQNIEITDVSHLHGSNYEYGYLMKIPVHGVNYFKLFDVVINNRKLKLPEIKKLAINDGFDSVEDFFAYFDTDFQGQIIHWTDLKY